jgi:serine/threonine protein kinase
MGAAFATKTSGWTETEPALDSRLVDESEKNFDTWVRGHDSLRPTTLVDLEEFKRAVQELGLLRRSEFERFVTGALGGVAGLAKALVKARKLTAYQAAALCQGKSRGLVIGNYFILDKLGAGGMGVVFKAKHRRLDRIVAIKMLPPSLARDRDLLLRFRREVKVAARLSHPNLVAVLDADEDRGVQFMTMEYIEGSDLDRLVRGGGALPAEKALDYVIQAARGLEAAHSVGIVHRDIKPGNLMLDDAGRVRVLDLGLARLVEVSQQLDQTTVTALTQPGMLMGTVDFMAPEQGMDSRQADHRADVYSLGCTLYYLLTTRPPFGGSTFLSRLMAHQEQSVPSLTASRPDVFEGLDMAFHRMMAKNPSERPDSMTSVIALLEACRPSLEEASKARSSLKKSTKTVAMKHIPQARIDEKSLVSADVSPQPAHSFGLSRARLIGLGVGAVVLLCIGGLSVFLNYPGKQKPVASVNVTKAESVSAGAPLARSPAMYDVATRHVEPIDAFAVTADGRLALTGGRNGTTMWWLGNGTLYRPYQWHHGGIYDLAMTPDGRRALVGTWGFTSPDAKPGTNQSGYLRLLDLEAPDTHALFAKQPYDKGHVRAVAISPDGRLGLSSSQDGKLILWDLVKYTSLRTFGPQKGNIHEHCIAFHPDHRNALTGGSDQFVHVWNLDTGEETKSWKAHDAAISGLAVSTDGHHIVTGGFDNNVILWDFESGTEIWRFEMPDGDKGPRITFDADGNVLAAGAAIGHLILLDGATGVVLRRDERPFGKHRGLAALPQGRVVTSDVNAVRIWTPRGESRSVSGEDKPGKLDASHGEGPVDLLSLIQPGTFKDANGWRVINGVLNSPTQSHARLHIPYTLPSEYQIDMEIDRGNDKPQAFCIFCSVQSRQTALFIDDRSSAGLFTGMDGIEGIPVAKAVRIHAGQVLFASRIVRLSLTVLEGRIRLRCDGKDILDWQGDPKSLIRSLAWGVPNKNELYLGSPSSILIHKLTLTPK